MSSRHCGEDNTLTLLSFGIGIFNNKRGRTIEAGRRAKEPVLSRRPGSTKSATISLHLVSLPYPVFATFVCFN